MSKTSNPSGTQENKMGTMPVGKLLFQMSIPMIVSMLVLALYNVVDSIFVSQISENALTAVSLAFPIQNLMVSIATGTAVGINALVSRHLGEKDFNKANLVARHGIFLAFCSYVVFMVVMIFITVPFMTVQAGNDEIFSFGVQYLHVISYLGIFMFMQVMLERLVSSTGKTHLTMISQATGAIVNIIFDPILIFGYGPFPEMGVRGAAIATVFGQLVGAGLALFFNLNKNKELNINMKGFRPNSGIIKAIYQIAVPSIILVSVGSVMTFGMNIIFVQLLASSTAAAVFGVYFKLNSLVVMPVLGMNNGMVPIIAFNYGAKNKKRIMDTTRLAVTAACVIMVVGIIVFLTVPDKLLLLFNASENMLAIGVPALKICCLSYVFAGFCIVIGSTMQALGSALYSMINSLCRQLIVLLPAAFILAKVGGLDLVWWAYPIAELASVTLSSIFFAKVYKQKIRPLH
ncbi:MAG: MATE family efflux transporter [Lachnospiraceae bacterium]|nr:MATE family efflux transporter [Lachnospiraceae bacterium]